jgi:hypothetical protein
MDFNSLQLLQKPTTCQEIEGVAIHDFQSPCERERVLLQVPAWISTPCSYCKSPLPARSCKELKVMIFEAHEREREFYCKCLHSFPLPVAFANAHYLPGDWSENS